MTDSHHHERRQFIRIPFDVRAHVNDQQGGLYLNCAVIDVSLKGLLIEKPADWTGQIGMSYDIDLILDDAQIVIKVSSTVAHIDGQRIGFESQQLDLDSMMHLKRLISLNLGDESLLHRELSTLIAQ
jgi:hypothetical protein